MKTIPKSLAGDSVNPWPNLIKVSAIVVFVELTVVLVPPIDKFPAIVTLAPLVVIAVVPSLALIILPPNFKLDANSTSVLALGSVIDEFPALFLIVLSPLVPNCTVLSFNNIPSNVTPEPVVFSLIVSTDNVPAWTVLPEPSVVQTLFAAVVPLVATSI